MSIEDESGISNLIVFPDLFQRERLLCVSAPLLWAEGILQRQGRVVHVRVEQLGRLGRLEDGSSAAMELRSLSHDFH